MRRSEIAATFSCHRPETMIQVVAKITVSKTFENEVKEYNSMKGIFVFILKVVNDIEAISP